ncbi:ABC transporter substrate-binding protein [uncultured Maritimibacter sp.]|jgi:ABC-type amino acid transport substrate-binding protein|uniref:substrate-binding periplasmic protein n=1 Tax=uncultured Maritimibacter sp. TaxID=991866 RepID=UPI000A6EC2F6|nr:transporter substrate-binding domain-containing protein [uncultured Maritimibacter sp.]
MTYYSALAGLLAGLAIAGPALARCEDHVPQARPQNTFAQDIGREFDTIVDEGWMEFALYDDFAPWSYEQDGKVVGVDVEIARLIAEDIGVEPRFRLVQAGENLDADLLNYVWKGAVVGGRVSDVMMHVPYDSDLTCRIEQAVFTGQYAAEELAIAYSLADYPDEGPTPAYFRFDTVAVENDSISDFYLSSLGRGAPVAGVHRFATSEAAMDELVRGEVMAAMAPRAVLEAGMTEDLGLHVPPYPGLVRSRWTVGVAVNFQHRDLGYAVDYAIEKALADGRIEAIFAERGLTFLPPER